MAETEKVTRPWDKLRERYTSRNPEKEYSGENAEDALVADVLAELDDAVFTLKDRAMREGLELIYNVHEMSDEEFAKKIRNIRW